jgi:hypothetical protein
MGSFSDFYLDEEAFGEKTKSTTARLTTLTGELYREFRKLRGRKWQ